MTHTALTSPKSSLAPVVVRSCIDNRLALDERRPVVLFKIHHDRQVVDRVSLEAEFGFLESLTVV